jgi:hypothetical protein
MISAMLVANSLQKAGNLQKQQIGHCVVQDED